MRRATVLQHQVEGMGTIKIDLGLEQSSGETPVPAQPLANPITPRPRLYRGCHVSVPQCDPGPGRVEDERGQALPQPRNETGGQRGGDLQELVRKEQRSDAGVEPAGRSGECSQGTARGTTGARYLQDLHLQDLPAGLPEHDDAERVLADLHPVQHISRTDAHPRRGHGHLVALPRRIAELRERGAQRGRRNGKERRGWGSTGRTVKRRRLSVSSATSSRNVPTSAGRKLGTTRRSRAA